MTHGRGESDSAIVAGKPTNEAERTATEPVEPRAEAEGNVSQQSTGRAQSRGTVSQALARIRQAARQRKKEKFTALLHHISIDLLDEAFFELKEDAAAGVDGLSWADYEQNLERNLEDLHARIHRGAYRALPSRRVYIAKPDGRQRPLAIAALEDKIVQRATVAVLNAIYEEDFLGFSYGFRPGRSTHDALDALVVGIESTKVSWILDADIRSFFDEISQEWLIRFLEHRIGDRRIIRLIQKWLKAGILEDGVVTISERGTGQGAVISPLLANVYLHYVLDLWAERWRRREATGDMTIVRYADDFIVGFTRDRVQKNLSQIPKRSAAGVDGQTVEATKESFERWIEPMLLSIHRQGYRAPNIRRVYIPKPGKTEKRPLGVPTVSDRALQRSTAEVLSAIYEQDFLPCSFGGRPKLGAHHALA